jgi:hypothetical protein
MGIPGRRVRRCVASRYGRRCSPQAPRCIHLVHQSPVVAALARAVHSSRHVHVETHVVEPYAWSGLGLTAALPLNLSSAVVEPSSAVSLLSGVGRVSSHVAVDSHVRHCLLKCRSSPLCRSLEASR